MHAAADNPSPIHHANPRKSSRLAAGSNPVARCSRLHRLPAHCAGALMQPQMPPLILPQVLPVRGCHAAGRSRRWMLPVMRPCWPSSAPFATCAATIVRCDRRALRPSWRRRHGDHVLHGAVLRSVTVGAFAVPFQCHMGGRRGAFLWPRRERTAARVQLCARPLLSRGEEQRRVCAGEQ